MPTSSADETESQGTAPSETSAESSRPANLADALMDLPISDLSHIAAAASAILAGKLKIILTDDGQE
jgi:hypothetical protein